MFLVAWPLNFLWLILIENNWWLFWAQLNRACLNHPFDSTNTTMGESKELSVDLKDHITDLQKSGKSLAAISKQLQAPKSTEQTTVCGIEWMPQLCQYHDQEENKPAAERKLVRMAKSQPKTTKKQVSKKISSCWKTHVSVHSEVCFTSTWAKRLQCITWTKKEIFWRKTQWLDQTKWAAICLEERRWGL